MSNEEENRLINDVTRMDAQDNIQEALLALKPKNGHLNDNQLQIDDFTEPFDDEETIEQRKERKNRISRNLHNQKTYYDQKVKF